MLRLAALILALAASTLARGEGRDGPDRLAWLAYVEGTIEFEGAGERRTTELPDRPLRPGDRLATRNDSRAEVSLGTAAIRLDEESELSIADLRAKSVRIKLAGHVANVSLYELLDDERFELVTPGATIVLDAAGEYRVDFMSESAITLSVRSGAATVATAGGPIQVLTGQRVHLDGGSGPILMSARSPDAFDDWVLEREVQLASAEPPPAGGYEEYGQWRDEPVYGRVWMSSYSSYDDWGSYGLWVRNGHGSIWVGSAPCCGSIHGGRWVFVDHFNRWCWVPPVARPLPSVARVTHPYGATRARVARQGGQATVGSRRPVTTTLGGGSEAARPRTSTSWGGATMRPSGASTMSSSRSSGTSSASSSSSGGSSRPFGSSSRSRPSSSSSGSSPLSGLTHP